MACNPLPPPVEINAQRPAPEPEPKPESGGLLSKVKSLLSAPQPGQQIEAAEPSHSSATFSTSEPLAQESEQILSRVPKVIGEEFHEETPVDQVAPETNPLTEMMAGFTFEVEDVRSVVAGIYGWAAKVAESDHWKLDEEEAQRIAKPAAKVLNFYWAKAVQFLPDGISQWIESTPGVLGLIMAGTIITVPRVTKQMAISAKRKQQKKPVPEVQPIKPRVHGVPDPK